MVLKNFLYLTLLFFFEICTADFGSDSSCFDLEFRDFRYKADLVLDTEHSLVGIVEDMFSGSEIEEEIKSLRTFKEQGKTVSNIRALTDRIKLDISTIYKKTHMLGFYETNVRYKTQVKGKNEVIITIYVDLGKIFKLELNVKYLDRDDEFGKKYRELLQQRSKNLTASIIDIKNIISGAVYDLQTDGFFDPEIIEKRVRIDYDKKIAVLNLTIDPKQNAKFYFTEIKAYPGIDPQFIKNRILWSEGAVYDIRKIDKTSDDLQNTQIFSNVKVEPLKDQICGDRVPILISLEEDKRHIVDFSLLYSTMKNMNFDRKKSQVNKSLKSIIARLSWMDCNAFGGGEKLRFTVEGTPIKVKDRRADYAFEAAFLQPDVFVKNNTAEYICSRHQELTNVFFKKSDKISLMFNYPLWFFTTMRAGGFIEKNYVDGCAVFFANTDENRRYENATIPFEVVLDKTDDLLNPTSGYRASAKFSHMQFKSSSIGNLQSLDLNFSYNYPFDEFKKTVFAFKIVKKTLFGKDIDKIPLDKRIYAGGISSVRGFANQMATEMVIGEETPMGGKSSIEFGTEIRRKISGDFGAVLFFDGAKIFQNQSHNTALQIEKKRWFLSYGVGVRYYTSAGPIRADLALPVKRRKYIDSKVQFILSLGQAF